MYLLKLALRPWRLAPFSQIFSAAAVGLLLFLVGFMIWMQLGLRPVLARIHGEQVITAYLDPAVDVKDEARVLEEIRGVRDSIEIPAGAQATGEIAVVDSPRFIANIKAYYPDLGAELEGLGKEVETLVPRYVSISGIFADSTLDKIRAVKGVESAESSKDRHSQTFGAFLALRWVARLLAAGLCLALLTGLVQLSRINGQLHEETLGLLRLMGASAWQLQAPSVLSGLFVGLAGGALACAGWIVGGVWLAGQIRSLSPLLKDLSPLTVGGAPGLALLLLALGAALGMVAGVFAALSAKPGAESRG